MRLLARRKVVLVIVEGVSEETALGIALSNVYDKDAVYIHIMHGDITTRKGVNSKNIVSKIGNDVKTYAKHSILPQKILNRLFILWILMELIL